MVGIRPVVINALGIVGVAVCTETSGVQWIGGGEDIYEMQSAIAVATAETYPVSVSAVLIDSYVV